VLTDRMRETPTEQTSIIFSVGENNPTALKIPRFWRRKSDAWVIALVATLTLCGTEKA